MSLQLSVLDQSMIVSGRSPAASIRETVDMAVLCDRLGYARFWVSEHHNSGSIAGTAPEVLLGALAMATQRIRLGAAGIMLPHYASLKVAEQFRVLEALAPGRIDLGLGRAPGSDGKTAFALNPEAASAADFFPAQIRDVTAWVHGESLIENHPFQGIEAQPRGPGGPQIWVLGSSTYGAQVAAFFGLPYCFAYFFSDGVGAEEALALYRENFQPSPHGVSPYSAICVLALAADSAAQAGRLQTTRDVWRAERERGRYVPLPSWEEAERFGFTPEERARNAARPDRDLFGTVDVVSAGLRRLAAGLQVDEVALVTPAHDPADRQRSFSLLAQAFSLPGAAGVMPIMPGEARPGADLLPESIMAR